MFRIRSLFSASWILLLGVANARAQDEGLRSGLWITYILPTTPDLVTGARDLESNCLGRRTTFDQQCQKPGCEAENELSFRRCIGQIDGTTWHLAVCFKEPCGGVRDIGDTDFGQATDPDLNATFGKINPGRYAATGSSVRLTAGLCTLTGGGNSLEGRTVGNVCYRVKTFVESEIYDAIKRGEQGTVQFFLDRGIKLNYNAAARTARAAGQLDGGTVDFPPLNIVARTGNVEMASFLIRRGALIDVAYLGESPLIAAIDVGDTRMVEFLLRNGADARFFTPLVEAIHKHNTAVAKLLVESGARADLDTAVISTISGDRENTIATALEAAARDGDVTMAQFVVSLGAQVNRPATDLGGRLLLDKAQKPVTARALCLAAGSGELEVVKYLLEKGADPNGSAGALADDGRPLTCARDVATIKWLLPRTKLAFPLGYALERCSMPVLKVLLPEGTAAREPASRALFYGVRCPDGVEYLLNHGADVNTRDPRDGWTALHQTAACGDGYGCLQTSKVLVEHGASLKVRSTRDSGGYPPDSSALDIALKRGASETVKLLRSHGGQ